jgi:para-aminobenzoate synthetase component I
VDYAHFGRRLARDVVEISDDVGCLDKGGFWAVVVTFEGEVTCVRFAQVGSEQKTNIQMTGAQPQPPQEWVPLAGAWSSSLEETATCPASGRSAIVLRRARSTRCVSAGS